jgi:hypothetical protein
VYYSLINDLIKTVAQNKILIKGIFDLLQIKFNDKIRTLKNYANIFSNNLTFALQLWVTL